MRGANFFRISALVFVFLCAATFEVRVVAVVGQEPILSSEVELVMLERGLVDTTDEEKFKANFQAVLDELINDKLALIAAEKESIQVSDDEINKYFSTQWSEIESKFKNRLELEEEIKKSGYTIDSFKRKLKKMVRDALIKQRFLETKFPQPMITDEEVKRFYDTYKDSLPPIPEMVKLEILELTLSDLVPQTKYLADSLYLLMLKGVSLDSMKILLAKDSRVKISDIDSVKRGDYKPVLDSVIFSTQEKSFSRPVQDEEGNSFIFYIRNIRDDKRDISVVMIPQDKKRILSNLKPLVDTVYNWFAKAETIPDTYNGFKVKRTTVDYTPITSFAEDDQKVIEKSSVGDIMPPVPLENGFRFIKIIDKKPEQNLTLENNYNEIKSMARAEKRKKQILNYLEQIKESVYIEKRTEY